MKRILLICILATSCVKNPVTGERELHIISENQERQIGTEAYKTALQSQGGSYTLFPELTQYVSSVGNKLAMMSDRPNLSYEFVVVNDSIPNAWALPGGKIAINRGLLVELQSEAELAAVLGHEIVHAAARHGAKGMERGMLLQGGIIALGVATRNAQYNDVLLDSGKVAASFLMSKYSRKQELESDHYGMIYMAKAGYNPDAAIRLQELFLKLSKGQSHWVDGLFASHPPSHERIVANEKTSLELASYDARFEGKQEYQEKIASLVAQKAAYDSYDEGQKALSKKNYKKAEECASRAIQSFSKDGMFWYLKGKALLAQNHYSWAQSAFSEAITRNASFYDFYLQRAICKKMLGDLSGAKVDAQASIDLLPTGEAHEMLGTLALHRGDKKRALYHLQIASHAKSHAGQRARALLKKMS